MLCAVLNHESCDVPELDLQARTMTGWCVDGGELAVLVSVTVTGSCGEGSMPCSRATTFLAVCSCNGSGQSWTVWWRAVQAVHDSP